MRRIVAMGGEPATGKSTIVRKLMEGRSWTKHEPEKLVVCHYDVSADLQIVGDYSDPDHKFPGTDRLSMAVQPQALKFFKEAQSNILFEGDRLFNMSLLEEVASWPDVELKIYIITADKSIKEGRHQGRADTQDDQFKKAKETKTERIMSNFMLMDLISVAKNNTPEDLDLIVNDIRRLLYL